MFKNLEEFIIVFIKVEYDDASSYFILFEHKEKPFYNDWQYVIIQSPGRLPIKKVKYCNIIDIGGMIMVKKKISTALSAALIVSMLATGLIVTIQGNTTLEIAKSAGDKKVEVVKA
ncbi:hypothetical protein ABGV43_18315 [Paenibacillus amylolyticus]